MYLTVPPLPVPDALALRETVRELLIAPPSKSIKPPLPLAPEPSYEYDPLFRNKLLAAIIVTCAPFPVTRAPAVTPLELNCRSLPLVTETEPPLPPPTPLVALNVMPLSDIFMLAARLKFFKVTLPPSPVPLPLAARASVLDAVSELPSKSIKPPFPLEPTPLYE